MILSIILLVFQVTTLPSWVLETPKNCITVTVKDSYTRDGRTLSIFKEANRILAMQSNVVSVNGNNAYLSLTHEKQKDKIDLIYTIQNEFKYDQLEKINYILLDYYRIEGKLIFALFGKIGSHFNKDRILINQKPSWVSNRQNHNTAIGFGSNNEFLYSNWIEAFNHALFNLGHMKSVYTYQKLIREKSNTQNSFFKVNINFVDAKFDGIRITKQWIDPISYKIYILMEDISK